ncbi:MAG: L-threonylcarbamoyladenylate synthase [Bacillus sp. (in: firmicutes)]
MRTEIWKVNKEELIEPQIQQAADLLRQNQVVAFPTETVYGLGGNAESEAAVKLIYEAKGRPSDNPLIVHISNREQLSKFVMEIPSMAEKLMEAFWPGPLTLLFKVKKGSLAQSVTPGLDTVAVRMPDHPVALALIETSGVPVAAPSANLSGKPSPTSASHVERDLYGRVSGIVDGGPTGVGVESTVLDCTGTIPVILRPGGVTKEQIEAVIGKVGEDLALRDKKAAPKAPGMKYTHYAPRAPFILVDGGESFLQSVIDEARKSGKKVGALITEESRQFISADQIVICGERQRLATIASNLYHALRTFDELDIDVIYGEMYPREGIGEAIMNRLTKAAGNQILQEGGRKD